MASVSTSSPLMRKVRRSIRLRKLVGSRRWRAFLRPSGVEMVPTRDRPFWWGLLAKFWQAKAIETHPWLRSISNSATRLPRGSARSSFRYLSANRISSSAARKYRCGGVFLPYCWANSAARRANSTAYTTMARGTAFSVVVVADFTTVVP